MSQSVKVVIPQASFNAIFDSAFGSRDCVKIRCPYTKTKCCLKQMLVSIHNWWNTTNGEKAPGFVCYETIFHVAIKNNDGIYLECCLFVMFGGRDVTQVRHRIYNEIVAELKAQFERRR